LAGARVSSGGRSKMGIPFLSEKRVHNAEYSDPAIMLEVFRVEDRNTGLEGGCDDE